MFDEKEISKGSFFKLKDIGPIQTCHRVFKNETSSDYEIPFYTIGSSGSKPNTFISRSMFEEYKNKYPFPQKGDVLLSAIGTIGKVSIYDGEDAYFKDCNLVWFKNDESLVLNKYLYYFYSTFPWKINNVGTLGFLSQKDILNTDIFVQSIKIQKEIVNILDSFLTYSNDIIIGLPAEIQLRQQQLQYYLNRFCCPDFSKQ